MAVIGEQERIWKEETIFRSST